MRKAANLNLIISLIVFAFKLVGYQVTGSSAIFSDALETIVNVIAALVGLFIIKTVLQPADQDHPYGHGKLEFFSAAFEGGLVVFASLGIIFQSAQAFREGKPLQSLTEGMLFVGIATVLNAVFSVYLKRVAEKENSEALRASAFHLYSDVVTSLAVIGGLLFVQWTGWAWLDPLMALLISGHLAFEGSKIIRQNLGGLVDEIDLEKMGKLAEAFKLQREEGLINVHNVRMIRSGRFHHIDAHLVVPEFWDIDRVHALANKYEAQVIAHYPFEGEIAFHVDPCHRKYCENCDLSVCPVRKKPFQQLPTFDIQSLLGNEKKTNQSDEAPATS